MPTAPAALAANAVAVSNAPKRNCVKPELCINIILVPTNVYTLPPLHHPYPLPPSMPTPHLASTTLLSTEMPSTPTLVNLLTTLNSANAVKVPYGSNHAKMNLAASVKATAHTCPPAPTQCSSSLSLPSQKAKSPPTYALLLPSALKNQTPGESVSPLVVIASNMMAMSAPKPPISLPSRYSLIASSPHPMLAS